MTWLTPFAKQSRGEAVLHPRVAERVIREINGGKGVHL